MSSAITFECSKGCCSSLEQKAASPLPTQPPPVAPVFVQTITKDCAKNGCCPSASSGTCKSSSETELIVEDERAPLLGASQTKKKATLMTCPSSIPSSAPRSSGQAIASTDTRMNASVFGIHCADCAANIEKVLLAKSGVSYAAVSAVTGKAQIRYDVKLVRHEDLLASISQLGYRTEILPASATDSRILVSLNGGDSGALIPLLEKLAGVSSIKQRANGIGLVIDFDPAIIGPRSLLQSIRNTAPQAQLIKGNSTAQQEALAQTAYWRRLFLLALLLSLPCIFLAYIVPLIPILRHLFSRQLVTGLAYGTLISWAFSTPVQFVLGAPLYASAFRGLVYARQLNMDLLVMLSTTTAYVYSFVSCIVSFALSEATIARNFFEISAILLTLILFGRYLEILAKGRTSDVLSRVQQMQATTAILVLDSGVEEGISADLVQRGDLLKVVPGDKIPVDGVVQSGRSSVNEAMITGESLPVSKREGCSVFGSSLNHSGVLYVRAEKSVDNSTLAQLGGLVSEAQQSKPPLQRTADTVAAYFIPFILLLAICAFVVWYLLASRGIIDTRGVAPAPFALSFFLTVLVISCPCAIALAVPPAIMVSTSVAARYGVLFKGGGAVESTAKVSAVAFDKTGTLTTGNIAVRQVYASPNISLEANLLEYAASVERDSEHPIARAIVVYARDQRVELKPCSDFASVAGKGVKAVVNNVQVLIGTEAWLSEHQALLPDSASTQKIQWEEAEYTVVCLAVQGQFAGLLALSDTLRPEAKDVVMHLKANGKRVVMLSGDNERTVKAVASQLGIDEAYGGLLPAGKVDRLRELQSTGQVVAMVGDGVNDALALVQANVGVAIGTGAQLSVAAAQLVLLRESLTTLLIAFDVARVTMRRIRMNFLWAFFYNLIMMPIASGALYPIAHFAIPPALAGLSEVFSSLPVIFSSLHLTRYTPPQEFADDSSRTVV